MQFVFAMYVFPSAFHRMVHVGASIRVRALVRFLPIFVSSWRELLENRHVVLAVGCSGQHDLLSLRRSFDA